MPVDGQHTHVERRLFIDAQREYHDHVAGQQHEQLRHGRQRLVQHELGDGKLGIEQHLSEHVGFELDHFGFRHIRHHGLRLFEQHHDADALSAMSRL